MFGPGVVYVSGDLGWMDSQAITNLSRLVLLLQPIPGDRHVAYRKPNVSGTLKSCIFADGSLQKPDQAIRALFWNF